ncbi:MAG: RagB/SusD family nutrient uptake outer membrane protein [Prevotellaceae bacterium]|nr:RagB/SusD family nutrient uptake outer membrane protein [Prevotellaceae bacterium]
MKIYILTLLAISLAMVSCTKFLEEDPKASYTTENFYTNAEALSAGVVGTYSALINLYVVNTNTPLFIGLVGTDEAMSRATGNNIRPNIDKYNYTASESSILEYWGRHYTIIARANEVIDIATGMYNVSDSLKKVSIGEARFIRAWAYFKLVQSFGAVPLVLDRLADFSNFDFGLDRAPVDAVYSQIIKDLEYCIQKNVLPKAKNGGRVTHYAAKTLLAKVYLTMASAKESEKVEGYANIEMPVQELYQKSYNYSADVMINGGYSLLPKYSDVFDILKKNSNTESIFEIQFSSVVPYGTQWSKEFGSFYSGGASGGTAAAGFQWRERAVAGPGQLVSVPSFRHYYTRDGYDIRRKWNLADSIIQFNANNEAIGKLGFNQLSNKGVVGENGDANAYKYSGVTKYRWGEHHDNMWKDKSPYLYTNEPTNVIVLRYADVLLMFAEADLKLNGGTATQAGVDAVNLIVQRARGLRSDGITPVTEAETPTFKNYTTSTLTFDEIMKERARELCFEFQRWYDLARTGTFEKYLSARDAFTNTRTNFNPNRNYLLPIPQTEIDKSTNKSGLYQNPRY